MTRNCIGAGAALALSTLVMSAWSPAGAQDWPTRTVKFILPIGAGSGAGAGASLGLDTHEGIELTPVRVVETQEVTHIRYAVGDRAKLELDDRGSGGA